VFDFAIDRTGIPVRLSRPRCQRSDSEVRSSYGLFSYANVGAAMQLSIRSSHQRALHRRL